MRTYFKKALAVFLLSTVSVSLVYADFCPIPVLKKLKNVVTVAKSGGQCADVKKAIDAIDDATTDNPYPFYSGPGVYTVTEQIPLKAYISAMGKGSAILYLKKPRPTSESSSLSLVSAPGMA